MNPFEKLGLSKVTVDAITKKGFEKPSPIQEKTIPLLLSGEGDVIGQAQTGTGKTACFALPILENITEHKNTQALVLCPTRELALQVAKEIDSLKGTRNVRIAAVYGGANIREQMDVLRKGVQIVVGTPGRLMDLLRRNRLDISNIRYAVLDEADEMLNMGFVDDIETILAQTPKEKQMLLFSATMPKEILRIAKKFMHEYQIVKDEGKNLATDLIEQEYYDIMGKDRFAALKRLIAHTPEFHGIVFCKTRGEVDTVTKKLIHEDIPAAAIHGEISQSQRESSLKQFRDKKISLLIATDVAARGIDVTDLNVVINYSLPQSPETYVHRIGRTGRAGNKGKAITFIMPSEKSKLKFVEKVIGQSIPKGKLPTVNDIIASKKDHIQETILASVHTKETKEYQEIAKKLLQQHDSEAIVSAVLAYAFAKQLDANQFKEVEEVTRHISGGGSGRASRGSFGRSRGGDRGGSRDRRGGSRGGSRGSSPGSFAAHIKEKSGGKRGARERAYSRDEKPRDQSSSKPRDRGGSRGGSRGGKPRDENRGKSRDDRGPPRGGDSRGRRPRR